MIGWLFPLFTPCATKHVTVIVMMDFYAWVYVRPEDNLGCHLQECYLL